MDDKEATAAVREVRLAHPFSIAFWNCFHQDSISKEWEEESLVGNPVAGSSFRLCCSSLHTEVGLS